MRKKFGLSLVALVMVLTLGVVSASADQITLGDTSSASKLTFTSTGGDPGSPIDVTGTLFAISGSFGVEGGPYVLNNEPWSLTPTGTDTWQLVSLAEGVFDVGMLGHVITFEFGSVGDEYLTGTVVWDLVKDGTSIPNLVGWLTVTNVTGTILPGPNGYSVGGVYPIDYTLQGVTPTLVSVFNEGDGATTSGRGSAGQIPVPEPATLMLLGTGLIGLAGVARRKLKKS